MISRSVLRSAALLLAIGVCGRGFANFHGGMGHEGYSAADGPANAAGTVWEATAPDFAVEAGTSVAVGNGVVFAYGHKISEATVAKVACFDRLTGGWLWTGPDLDGEYTFENWGWPSPVYDPNTGDLFIATGYTLYRLDPDNDGEVVWDEPLPGGVVNGTVLVTPSYVCGHTFRPFMATDSYIYSYDLDGGFNWQNDDGGAGSASPASDGTYIYDLIEETLGDPQMRAYDPVSGATIWSSTLSLSYSWSGGLALADGYLYAQTYNFSGDGELVKVDATNGAEEWVRPVPSGDATPTVGDGLAIGLGDWSSAKVFAYTTDGVEAWGGPTDVGGSSGWTVSAVRAGRYVYVATGGEWGSAGLTVLDAIDGSIVHANSVNVSGTPVVDGEDVIVPGADGSVYCFRCFRFNAAAVADWEMYY